MQCDVSTCNRSAFCRGLCRWHYQAAYYEFGASRDWDDESVKAFLEHYTGRRSDAGKERQQKRESLSSQLLKQKLVAICARKDAGVPVEARMRLIRELEVLETRGKQ